MAYEKKYDLIKSSSPNLYRIRALKDFYDVKKGDIGGYVESEKNLSQEGNCWVFGNAEVSDNAQVYGNARICDNAKVYGKALICGNSLICGNARICGNAKVSDDALICGVAQVYDNAKVFDSAQVYGNVRICDNAKVYGKAQVSDDALICGNAKVFDDAQVYGNAVIYGKAGVSGNAMVETDEDYIVFKNWWSSGRYFTWTRSNDKYSVGCFFGSGQELIKKAYADSEKSGQEYERIVRYVEEIKK